MILFFILTKLEVDFRIILELICLKKIFVVIIVTILFNPFSVFAQSLNCNQYLSFGNTGKDVSILQKLLNQKMGCKLSIDGIFGQKTDQCVRLLQKKLHVSIDGVVGPDTCSRLNSLSNKYLINQGLRNKVIVIARDVNIRKKPTTNSQVIRSASIGEQFRMVSYANGWYRVKLSNRYGYIRSDLVSSSLILLDISDQVLYFYRNGLQKLMASVVTGNQGTHDTPTGSFVLKRSNISLNEILRGVNDDGSSYASYVHYWMPFLPERGIGFHDASWRERDEYTSSTYQYDGSHGCVNMQIEDVEALYQLITEDTAVFVQK